MWVKFSKKIWVVIYLIPVWPIWGPSNGTKAPHTRSNLIGRIWSADLIGWICKPPIHGPIWSDGSGLQIWKPNTARSPSDLPSGRRTDQNQDIHDPIWSVRPDPSDQIGPCMGGFMELFLFIFIKIRVRWSLSWIGKNIVLHVCSIEVRKTPINVNE